MSYRDKVVRDRPASLLMFDGTGDVSGHNRDVDIDSLRTHLPIVEGTAGSLVFDSLHTARHQSPVYRRGQEGQSFTMEAWVRLSSIETGQQSVMSKDSAFDGIVFSGDEVRFSIHFDQADPLTVKYKMQSLHTAHVVGVKTPAKISLYVNGELVGEESLTPEQQNARYLATDGYLYTGETVSSQKIAVSGLATYPFAFAQEEVTAHYEAGFTDMQGAGGALSHEGQKIPVSLDSAKLFADQWWSTEQDWMDAELHNTAVVDDRLVPQFDNNISMAGHWIDNFIMSSTEETSIYGVSLNWDGRGATVEVSLDGETWTAAERGRNIDIIPEGFDPTDKDLYIRVSFPGGIENDDSYLDNLNAVGIISPMTEQVDGRSVTFDNASPEREYSPLLLHDNWGVEIGVGGSVTISVDQTEEESTYRSAEVWVKRLSSGPVTFSLSGLTYVDAEQGGIDLPVGQWRLIHIVTNTDMDAPFVISGNAQVGQVALYEQSLTSDDVKGILNQYAGNEQINIVGLESISIEKPAQAVKIYAHDWAIQSSG